MRPVTLDSNSIRDLAPAAPGRPRVMPAAFYRGTSIADRAVFGARHGLYGLPTVELIDWLKEKINGRTAIEIGAGHGVLADALGIPATDNRQQEEPAVAAYYAAIRQPVVQYGKSVEKLDAAAAVAKYRPQVVIASWVTHKYLAERHEAGGNENGVTEEAIIAACGTYIFIGNSKVHAQKSIWGLPHSKIEPDWLFSRAHNGSPDFIAAHNQHERPRDD
jgi:hypothetical protein